MISGRGVILCDKCLDFVKILSRLKDMLFVVFLFVENEDLLLSSYQAKKR